MFASSNRFILSSSALSLHFETRRGSEEIARLVLLTLLDSLYRDVRTSALCPLACDSLYPNGENRASAFRFHALPRAALRKVGYLLGW